MNGFFIGFAVPLLMIMMVVLFKVNLGIFKAVKTLKEIKVLLESQKKQ